MIGEAFEALFKAALPLGILSYFLFHGSLVAGRLGKITSRKALKSEFKRIRREARAAKKAGQKRASPNPLYNKWLKFGGGFYGLVALWTFMVIEIQEVIGFLLGFPGLGSLVDQLGFGLLIEFFINSLANFIRAIAWPVYWPDVLQSERILLWLAIAYAGYWLGMRAAWRKHAGQGSGEE